MNEKILIEKLLKFMQEMKDVLQKKEPTSMNKEESSDLDDEIVKCDNNGQWRITKKNKNL